MSVKGRAQRTRGDELKAWSKKGWLTEETILEAAIAATLRGQGIEVDAALKPLSLAEFMREFWPVLEPGVPLIWGMPLDAMCLHLEAAARRQIKKLIINVPPGTSKSTLTNIFFPAWVWAEVNPSERFLAVSFTEGLSMRDSLAMRRLVESDEFKARYGEKVMLMHDQNAKGQYHTKARGFRLVKPYGNATGARAGILLIDDPNNATEIDSRTIRRKVNYDYDTSLRMRGANPKTFVQIVVQQRLHEEDLTGHLEKKKGKGRWQVLRLPEEFEPEFRTVTYLDNGQQLWEDPRTERGELLHPNYRDRDTVDDMKVDLGSFQSAAQLQQRPVPAGGGIIKSWWWRYHAPAELIAVLPPIIAKVTREDGSVIDLPIPVIPTPEGYDLNLSSWDMAFKDTTKSDFVTGQVWGLKGASRFLRHQVRGRMSYIKTRDAVKQIDIDFPELTLHLVEDKANGSAIISDLHETVSGLVAIDPEGSKESRVNAMSPTVESGNFYLPHPSLPGFAWVAAEYLPEWAFFPFGANDDQVDATTQAEARFSAHLRRLKRDTRKPKPVATTNLSGLAGQGKVKSKWKR